MFSEKQKRYDSHMKMAQTWGELSHCERKKWER